MNKKGFTLVELLSVIAILAILIVLVLPNVLKLFNKSKKDIFVTEIKLIVKESNSHWMKDSLLNSQAAVYSKCVDDNCENQLDITARDILSYYVEMNALGKITKLYVSDGTYQYGLESSEIKLEDIDENAVEEINEENKIVIFCTGISNEGSEIIDDGSDITDGIRVTFNANGGSVSLPGKNYHLNSNYNTLPKPTHSGYTFLGWSTLPNGYQELEYIETTGTQYIDTGVYANEKTGFEIDFTTSDNFNTSSFGAIFGSVDNYAGSTATNRMEYGTWTGRDSSGYLFFGKSVKDANAVAAKLSKNNRLKASFINGVYKSPTGTTANIDTEPFTSQNSLLLFARRWTNNQIQYYSHIKLYSFKIFNGDELIKYFIPCLKKDDKVVGLYDVIGNTFYSNKGTGRFSKGSIVDNYIKSSTPIINANHTLYALWGHNPVVTYDTGGGSVSPTNKTFTYNSTYGSLPTPSKSGYTFVGWSSLPKEYQEVEYIESTGTQFIDTAFTATDGMIAEFDYAYTESCSGTIVGSHNASSPYARNQGYCRGSYWELGYGDQFPSSSSVNTTVNEKHKIIFSTIIGDAYLIVDDRELIKTNSKTNLIPKGTVKVFTSAEKNEGVSSTTKGKLYSLKIYDNNKELVRNYIPCYRISDNVIGLYDMVTKSFYVNKGTGKFRRGDSVLTQKVTSSTKMNTNDNHSIYAVWEYNPIVTFDANGGSVNPTKKTYTQNSYYTGLPTPTRSGYTFLGWSLLPKEYQEVEYVESTGTQYIDTTFIATGGMIAEFDFAYTGSCNGSIVGSHNTSSPYARNQGYCRGSYWELGYGDQFPHSATTNTTANEKHSIKFSTINGDAYLIVDNNELIKTNSRTNINPKGTVKIFNTWEKDSEITSTTKGKLYSLKIYDNYRDLVRNYIPCYRKSDNVIGLYDMVTKEFHINKGTGTLVKGNNIVKSYVTTSSKLFLNNDHTLYAIWN